MLAGVLPLAGLGYAARRSERAARALGLEPVPRRSLVASVLPGVAACVCLGLAAAQPGLRSTHRQAVRSQSEIVYVIDVSHSMAAAQSPGDLTRLARARTVVRRLHDATADVPSGIAGLTDRVLPFVFPTTDAAVFDATLQQSVLIEAPPPQEVSTNATSFDALTGLAGNDFFDRTAKRRTCVLVTDGESQSYPIADVADALGGDRGCRFVAVRVGGSGERVFGPDGVPEPGYAPNPAAAAQLETLARVLNGRSFAESDLTGAVSVLRADAETGPVAATPVRSTVRALAPWLALAALVLTIAFAWSRLRRGQKRLGRIHSEA